MSIAPQPRQQRHQLWRELAVPGVMVLAIALFVGDSLHLSYEALVFPAVLIVVVLVALAWALVVYLKGAAPAAQPGEGEDDEEGGPIVAATPWLLVLLPAVLVFAFDYLGVLTALVLLVFAGQAIFSLHAPLRSLLIAIAVVAPTFAVFKYVLYARFPAGILGLG
jgi:hypothetical protein